MASEARGDDGCLVIAVEPPKRQQLPAWEILARMIGLYFATGQGIKAWLEVNAMAVIMVHATPAALRWKGNA